MDQSKKKKKEEMTLSRKKRIIFSLTAFIGIPLCILLLLEIFLRIIRYGGETDFFMRDKKNSRLVFSKAGFQNWLRPRKLMKEPVAEEGSDSAVYESYTQVLSCPKKANVYRIFCLGASTTQGFPHKNPGAFFPTLLQEALRKKYPDKEFEVLNLGMSAISTFLIREQLKEVIGLSPDAVVFYAGHNEFCGYLGSSSNSSIGRKRFIINLHLFLSRLRLYSAVQDVVLSFLPHKGSAGSQELIAFLPKKSRIRPGDVLYEQTIKNFKKNCQEILYLCRRKDVPVVFCTVVSNERDFVPFHSFQSFSGGQEKECWEILFEEGKMLLSGNDYIKARAKFQAASEMCPDHAETYYRLARTFEGEERFEQALDFYASARDRDGLKLRAPSEINDTIRSLAENPGALIADCEAAFRTRSAGGLIGYGLITEHVHPNVKGEILIADTVLKAMEKDGLLPAERPENRKPFTIDDYRELSCLTELDDWVTDYHVFRMCQEPPFTKDHARPLPEIDERIIPLVQNHSVIPLEVLHLTLGAFYAADSGFEKSLRECRASLKINPGFYLARYLMGRIFEEQGLLADADREYELAEKAGEADDQAFNFHSFRTFDLAMRYYQDFAKKNPDHALTWFRLGYLNHLNGGDAERSLRYYQRVLNIDPSYVEAHFNMGLINLEKNNMEKAEQSYRQAIRIKPDYISAYYNLAYIYSQKGDKKKAIESYRKIIEIRPDEEKAYFNLGKVYEEMGRVEAAVDFYRQAAAIDPLFLEAFYQLGQVYKRRGEYHLACEMFEKVISLDPKFSSAYYLLADSCKEGGRKERAADFLKRLIENQPREFEAYFKLGNLYLEAGRSRDAVLLYTRLIDIAPENAKAYNNLGFSYYSSGEPRKAVPFFNKAIEIDPQDAYSYFNLGSIHADLGDVDEAISCFEKGLKLNPEDQKARMFLKELRKQARQ